MLLCSQERTEIHRSTGVFPDSQAHRDWSLLNQQKIDLPWFVSGGINESNIKKIQNLINPNGIDLSSGVEESPGIKSNVKINNLIKKFYDN